MTIHTVTREELDVIAYEEERIFRLYARLFYASYALTVAIAIYWFVA